MKNVFTSILVLLLVGIFAVGAFAQDKTQKQNFDGDQGIATDPHGDANRHDFKDDDPVDGPHGPMTDNADQGGEKLFLDEDGDGFDDYAVLAEEKSTDNVGKGGNVRNENQHKADAGPHGPANITDENLSKVFGGDDEDCDGTAERMGRRDMEQNVHNIDGESGPHSDVDGFGDDNDQDNDLDGVTNRVRGGRK